MPSPGKPRDPAVNLDQGAARVVHVRSGSFSPGQIAVRAGEVVRFVFDDPGHNATTVTSAGDMDPAWYPDYRGCSAEGDCTQGTSAAGTSWDYAFPYAADWPLVCGRHGIISSPMPVLNEQVWVHVTP